MISLGTLSPHFLSLYLSVSLSRTDKLISLFNSCDVVDLNLLLFQFLFWFYLKTNNIFCCCCCCLCSAIFLVCSFVVLYAFFSVSSLCGSIGKDSDGSFIQSVILGKTHILNHTNMNKCKQQQNV